MILFTTMRGEFGIMAASIGQLARSTGIEIVSFNIAAATTLTVGKLVALDASGNAVC